MESCTITKEIIEEFCKMNMSAHTDWTGTRVETIDKCQSVDIFADRLWDYIEKSINLKQLQL